MSDTLTPEIPETEASPLIPVEPLDPNRFADAVGKRKASIARTRIRGGTGKFVVNKRTLEDYFPRASLRAIIAQPLELTAHADKIDVSVNVIGGGVAGQAGAVRHSIARALQFYDPSLRPALKKAGYLTRDARRVERKKPGQPGARKRFQFSKR